MLDNQILNDLRINTFHAFGLSIIKEHVKNSGIADFLTVIDEDDKRQILSEIDVDKSIIAETSEKISEIKQSLISENQVADTLLAEIFKKYNHILRQSNAYDFDDLVSFPVTDFSGAPGYPV